jgi:hypothetical protein
VREPVPPAVCSDGREQNRPKLHVVGHVSVQAFSPTCVVVVAQHLRGGSRVSTSHRGPAHRGRRAPSQPGRAGGRSWCRAVGAPGGALPHPLPQRATGGRGTLRFRSMTDGPHWSAFEPSGSGYDPSAPNRASTRRTLATWLRVRLLLTGLSGQVSHPRSGAGPHKRATTVRRRNRTALICGVST